MEFEVTAQPDHIAKLKAVKKPILAIAELVWNGFDADATRVDVTIERNELGAVAAIEVADNGVAMSPEIARQTFQALGGSWKRRTPKTKENRALHGKEGKGRFKALGLGNLAIWHVCYAKPDGSLWLFDVRIADSSSSKFEVGPERAAEHGDRRGVRVRVSEIEKNVDALLRPSVIDEAAQIFGLYLRRYSQAKLYWDLTNIDPASIETSSSRYPLAPIKHGGVDHAAELEIVEWRLTTERRLYLCDAEGFPLDEMPPGIKAPGFNFSAYLKSGAVSELETKGVLQLQEIDRTLEGAIAEAKNVLRDHFRKRAEEASRGLIEKWKEEEIYPYREEPKSATEEQERQVFNIAALNLHSYLPSFDDSDRKAKQLQLRLLRHAIETGPEEALRFLSEALDLPPDRRQELADLLDRTTLSNIISAASLVTTRLEFLQGLRELVFSEDLKKLTKERSQLHRVVAPNAWLFGEQYHLAVDDQNLTEVLRKHLSLLGDETVVDDPVLRSDGSSGIIDLMLSRCVLRPGVSAREHLVVELKRPSVKIGKKEADQIESYANAIADDERFRATNTNWVMWVVSNEMDRDMERRSSQQGRAPGILYQPADLPIVVWVKTWAQIIDEARTRMQFFEEKLNYSPDRDASLKHLKETYSKHVGKLLSDVDMDDGGT